jgi:epoxyqueuosine reductase QueG
MNLADFCDYCGRCIRTCPGKAIPTDKTMVDGVLRYQIKQEQCYEKWRSLGTDCGICLSSCPISQGVDLTLLKEKKYSDIIQAYTERFPIRPYIRDEYF